MHGHHSTRSLLRPAPAHPRAAALVLLATVALLFTACTRLKSSRPSGTSRPSSPAFTRFERTEPQMGVPFRIVLYATNEPQARLAFDAAFHRIRQLNDSLSDYDTDSELSQLSRTAGTRTNVPVSADLWKVLTAAQKLAAASEGAFDVTVGPIVHLWRKARRDRQMPRADLLAGARSRTGWTKLHLGKRTKTARLDVEDMRLDLGGIAKGYAVDQALRTLTSVGIDSALVSGGGDLAVSEPPPGQVGWRIQLAPPDLTNAPPAQFVRLRHAALATSGDVFQYVEIGGHRYSHIVDPRTGLGLTDHSLVTVIARDCTTADSLATAVSVLGPARGLSLLSRYPDVDARIVRIPGRELETSVSRGFSRYLEADGTAGARP